MTCRKVDKKFETAYSEEKLLGYIIKLSRLTADEALYIPQRSVGTFLLIFRVRFLFLET